MNIVYLLTNVDKDSYPNKYIGSKVECSVIEVDGLKTMIDNKSDNLYYGSSCNPEMKNDMENGDRFEVSILHKIYNRQDLVSVENDEIIKNNAVDSDEFYNMGSALLDGFCKLDMIANCYGETLRERASRGSSVSKRDSVANKLGYSNFGDLSFKIHDLKVEGKNSTQIADILGCERHFPLRSIKDFNMVKAKRELGRTLADKEDIRKHYARQATVHKLSEMYGYEIPTIRYVIGDYKETLSYKVASSRGLTKEELEIDITKRILDGDDFRKVSDDMGIQLTDVRRYFLRCIRGRVKSSDLN